MFDLYNCYNIFKYYLFLFDNIHNIDELTIKNKNNYTESIKSMSINDR
jgi:hypothetical protein